MEHFSTVGRGKDNLHCHTPFLAVLEASKIAVLGRISPFYCNSVYTLNCYVYTKHPYLDIVEIGSRRKGRRNTDILVTVIIKSIKTNTLENNTIKANNHLTSKLGVLIQIKKNQISRQPYQIMETRAYLRSFVSTSLKYYYNHVRLCVYTAVRPIPFTAFFKYVVFVPHTLYASRSAESKAFNTEVI
jgi:hypothetical protein